MTVAVRIGGRIIGPLWSLGRLADYQRQFERTTRTVGEDPAIFATALETLAVNAFGDMGQTVQLRLIRDRFIAGHSNCDLRRHLDVYRRRLQSGMWLINAVFGKATLTRQFAGLVSQIRTRRIRHMSSAMQTVTMRPQGWLWSPDRDQARISWRTCSGG